MTKFKKICTYCLDDGATDDHVFAKCLWAPGNFPHEKNRAVKVPACSTCNGSSDETMWKGLLAVFNPHFRGEVVKHFSNPGGKTDWEKYQSLCRFYGKETRLYLTDTTLQPLMKTMLGIRRFVLKDAWQPTSLYMMMGRLKTETTWELKNCIFQPVEKRILHILPIDTITGMGTEVYELNDGFQDDFDKPRFQYRHFSFDYSNGVAYMSYVCDDTDNPEKFELVASFVESPPTTEV